MLWVIISLFWSCRTECKVVDGDEDGYTVEAGDCDDNQPLAHPEAEELCDGIDNDCNGEIDDGAGFLWFMDNDGDGYGDDSDVISSCVPIDGRILSDGDCNDQDDEISPGKFEECDGIDNDCNGQIDDNDDFCGQSLSLAHARLLGNSSRRFGNQVSAAGDLNGDGLGDIVIGAPSQEIRLTAEGRSYVFFGSIEGDLDPTQADVALLGSSEDTSGAQPSGSLSHFDPLLTADFNGDGYDDLALGVRGASQIGVDAGALHVVFGPLSGELDLPSQSASTWLAEEEGDRVGYSTAILGDVNDDGLDDILVGAHLHGQLINGAAYVVFGPALGSDLGQADVRFVGGVDAHLGYEVSPASDLNGDGVNDVMITAYRDPGLNGVFHGGATYVLYGPLSPNMSGELSWLDPLSPHDAVILGVEDRGQSGSTLSSAGDVDGDGLPDILIGSQFLDSGPLVDAGVMALFTSTPTGEIPLSDAEAIIWGGAAQDNFARSAAGLGDMNQDGLSEFAIGSKRSDLGSPNSGAVHLFSGAMSGNYLAEEADVIWVGEWENSWAGISLSAAGDIDGGGVGDILIGASMFDLDGVAQGAGYLILGESVF